MARPKTTRARRNKALKVIYLVMGYGGVGYLPAMLIGPEYGPRLSMVLAAGISILVGAKAKSILAGGVRGLLWGMLAGYALTTALIHRGRVPPEQVVQWAALYTLATGCLCAGVAALFAYMAKRRAQLVNDHWKG